MYKLMLEPIAYVVFQGVNVAMTATEAALYDSDCKWRYAGNAPYSWISKFTLVYVFWRLQI